MPRGNGTREWLFSLEGPSPLDGKELITIGLTGSAPAASMGGDAQVMLSFYTEPIHEVPGFSWSLKGGWHKAKGGSVVANMGFENVFGGPVHSVVLFHGFAVGAGIGFMATGFEGDIGVNFAFLGVQ